MAKIIKKELVWDVFCSADGSKIGKMNCKYAFDEELLKKMYSIISNYYDYTYNQFVDRIHSFVASVGMYDYCDYYSIEELKKDWFEQGIHFYIIAYNKWNMVEVEADYFSIQDTDGDDRPFTKATYQDYDLAVEYCREYKIDINSIVPQKWGTYVPLFD